MFAVCALAGPGRIAVVDGQVRYEAARGLVEHGDEAITDPDTRYNVFGGRDAKRYTEYRFPQILVGVVAIVLSDLVGPADEARRHFVFSLHGAVSAALLAVCLALWFKWRGRSPRAALGWAAAGVFCTPTFFYATAVFDENLGILSSVVAVVAAWRARTGGRVWLFLAALACTVAVNVKPPLAVFALPMLVALATAPGGRARAARSCAAVVAAVVVGVLIFQGLQAWRFPPEVQPELARVKARYFGLFFNTNPVVALLALCVSPGAGFLWYSPATVLGVLGLAGARRDPFAASVALAAAGFLVFNALLISVNGETGWGPRYLVPTLAVVWLFAPEGADRVHRAAAGGVLFAGLIAQILGLSMDPRTHYISLGLHSGFAHAGAHPYFLLQVAQLPNRPRHLWDVLRRRHARAEAFSPARDPLRRFPIRCFDAADPFCQFRERGPDAVRRYHVLSGLRPWPLSHRYLAPERRPVPLVPAVLLLAALVLLALVGLRGLPDPVGPQAPPRTTTGTTGLAALLAAAALGGLIGLPLLRPVERQPPPVVPRTDVGPRLAVLVTVQGDVGGTWRRLLGTDGPVRVALPGARILPRAHPPSSSTLPALTTLLSGAPPSRHGVRGGRDQVPPWTRLLPDHVDAEGRSTAAIVGGPRVGDKASALAAHFARWDEAPGREAPSATADRAIAWLAERRKDPGLLWVHFARPDAGQGLADALGRLFAAVADVGTEVGVAFTVLPGAASGELESMPVVLWAPGWHAQPDEGAVSAGVVGSALLAWAGYDLAGESAYGRFPDAPPSPFEVEAAPGPHGQLRWLLDGDRSRAALADSTCRLVRRWIDGVEVASWHDDPLGLELESRIARDPDPGGVPIWPTRRPPQLATEVADELARLGYVLE